MTPPTNTPEHCSPIKPNASFMISHPAHLIAFGLGSGLATKAPGTIGSLWGWASWLLIHRYFDIHVQVFLIVAAFLVGWWACTVTAQHMGISDPGTIVWDEVLAIWIIFCLIMPTSFVEQLAAFVLFRFFDIVKPGPVKWADQLFKGFGWKGGFGIIFDDLVAAFCTLLCIALWSIF